MKIVENKNPKMVPFSSIKRGDVFKYKDDIIIKVDTYKTQIGTLKAIRLSDGTGYICAFEDQNTLVEPLDATLVIN